MTVTQGTTADGFEGVRLAFEENSFGHFGTGGSVGWADPDLGLAFGYVMNRMDVGLAGDVRSANLVNACIAAVR